MGRFRGGYPVQCTSCRTSYSRLGCSRGASSCLHRTGCTAVRFCTCAIVSPSLCSGERIGYFSTHNRDAKVAEIAKTAARISQLSAGCPEVRFRKISPRDAPVCDCGFFFSSPCLRCSLRDRLVQHRCSERFRQF